MFARFDENLAMTLLDIKETKRYGRTDGRTHGQHENSIPTINRVCRGYNNTFLFLFSNIMLVIRAGLFVGLFSILKIIKSLVRIANREDPDQTASSEAV